MGVDQMNVDEFIRRRMMRGRRLLAEFKSVPLSECDRAVGMGVETGYRWMLTGERQACGSSISMHEAHLLQEVGEMAGAKVQLGIGAGFGFSAAAMWFCPARPLVIVIDDWSEGPKGEDGTPRMVRDFVEHQLPGRLAPRLRVHTGRSPEDVPRILGEEEADVDPLGLVLIDGEHTPTAVLRDFKGVLPFLGPQSVVFFHDSHSYLEVFDVLASIGAGVFDKVVTLRTYGAMTVMLNSRVNGHILHYFEALSLIWNNPGRWCRNLKANIL